MLCKYSILYEVLTSPYSIMTVQVGFLWPGGIHLFTNSVNFHVISLKSYSCENWMRKNDFRLNKLTMAYQVFSHSREGSLIYISHPQELGRCFVALN